MNGEIEIVVEAIGQLPWILGVTGGVIAGACVIAALTNAFIACDTCRLRQLVEKRAKDD